MRLVEPAALEVVAEARGDLEAEVELRLLGKAPRRQLSSATGCSAMARTIGTSSRAQLGEQRAHRGRRHALVGAVDQRIGDVVVGREEAGILAAEIERLLQDTAAWWRSRWPAARASRRRRRPSRAALQRATKSAGTLIAFSIVAPRDADQARVVIVGRQAFGVGREAIEQLAERRIEVWRSCASRVSSALWRPRAAAPPFGM